MINNEATEGNEIIAAVNFCITCSTLVNYQVACYSFGSEQNNMIKNTSVFEYGRLMMIETRLNEFLAGQKEQPRNF